jgi:hypothetical protein
MSGLLASSLGAVRVPKQPLDRAGSSGSREVIELAQGGESVLFVVKGIFLVRGGRLCGLVYPKGRNRFVNSTCPVS